MAVTTVQARFRFRTDSTTVDTAATWAAAENTSWTPSDLSQKFRLRFTINSTGTTATASSAWQLYVSRNGGTYAPVTTTSAFVQSADASSSADETAITTNQLTAGSGTRVNGVYDETGATAAKILGATSYMELEYGLAFSNPGEGDTYDFRVYLAGVALGTYTVTPRVTVATETKTVAREVQGYQLSNSSSDLTGSSLNKVLASSGATAGTWTGQSLGANAQVIGSFFTPSGSPSGPTTLSSLRVKLNVTTGNTNLRYSAQAIRVNASGVVQASGAWSADTADGVAGIKTLLLPVGGLGTFAAGDRLRLDTRVVNISASTAQSCTITYASADCSAHAGWANADSRWNYADMGAQLTLSNGDQSCTKAAPTNFSNVRATVQCPSTGSKVICEFTSNAVSLAADVAVGAANSAALLVGTSSWIGSDANSLGFYADGTYYCNGASQNLGFVFSSGNRVQMAVDTTLKRVWFRNLTTGSGWNGNDATNNPATGLGGASFSAMTGSEFYPIATLYIDTDQTTSSFTSLLGSIPAGFTAFDGSSLGPLAYTLALDKGAVPVAGQALTFQRPRSLPLAAGIIPVTGQAVGLVKRRTLALSPGSVPVTGQALSFQRPRSLPLATGIIPVAGQALSFQRPRSLPLATGIIPVAGQTVGLVKRRTLTLSPGSVPVAGQAAQLVKGRQLVLTRGTVPVTGQSVGLQASGWWFPGSAVDLDFMNDRYVGPALSVNRASTGYAYEPNPTSLAELVQSPGFDDPSPWDAYVAVTGSAIVSGGQASIIADGSGIVSIEQAIPTVPGRLYLATVAKLSGATLVAQARTAPRQSGATLGSGSLAAASGTITFEFYATATTTYVCYARTATTSGAAIIVDSFSVKEQVGWRLFANNVARRTSQGLLVEEARTNSIRNNSMQGAVAGTPGTLPTNWTITGFPGSQIIGIGTESGIDYIDLRLFGTTAGTSAGVRFEGTAGVAAAAGQTWISSLFCRLVGGSKANVSSLQIETRGMNSGVANADSASTSLMASVDSASLTASRKSSPSLTTVDAATTTVRPQILMTFAAGVSIDLTLRIGWPQMEQGAWASSPVRTISSAVTRNADAVTGPISLSYPLTVFVQGQWQAPVTAPTAQVIANLDAGASAERWRHFRNAASGAASTFMNAGGVTQASPSFPGIVYSSSARHKSAHAIALSDDASVVNGGAVNTAAPAAMPASPTLMTLGSSGGSFWLNGLVERVALFSSRLPNAQLQALTQPDVQLSLVASYGAIPVTGEPISLMAGRKLPLATGLVPLAGQAISFAWARKLPLAMGLVPLSGQAISFTWARKLPLAMGSMPLSGQGLTLKATRQVTLGKGSVSLSGQSVNLRIPGKITLDRGLAPLTGQALGLKAARTLLLSRGNIQVSGQALALTKARHLTLAMSLGAVPLSGKALGLKATRILSLSPGLTQVAGQPIQIKAARRLSLAPLAIPVSGPALSLRSTRNLALSSGVLPVSGGQVTLLQAKRLFLALGIVPIAGQVLDLAKRLAYTPDADITGKMGQDLLVGQSAKPTLLTSQKDLKTLVGGPAMVIIDGQ
jgi:hypothetical protein